MVEKTSSFCFGVFADTHYAQKPDDGVRYFQNSLGKLEDILAWFSTFEPDFLVCLGDAVDYRTDGESARPQFDELAGLLKETGLPVYFVLGNHDVCTLPRAEFARAFHFEERGYLSFDHEGTHFVVLDTNYDANGVPYNANTLQWDNTYIDATQLEWLKQDLAQTPLPTVVLAHANLDPRDTDGAPDAHVVKNHEEARRILTQSGKVKLVLQGHCHTGYKSVLHGIPYLTLRAVVEGCRNNYAMVVCTAQNGSFEINELSTQHIPANPAGKDTLL